MYIYQMLGVLGRMKGPRVQSVDSRSSNLLPTGIEEREVLGVGSIPVAILPSCQNMTIIAL